MNETATATATATPIRWLKNFYFTRGLVAAAWVGAAVVIGKHDPAIAGVLLVAYPAWDALANFVDARQNGGAGRNPTQAFNFVVSVLTAIAVVIALGRGMSAVFTLFGVWAALAGLLQLATGVRRWKTSGAQWTMILSGAQSTLVGAIFLKQASGTAIMGIADLVPYAGFGAFYFFVSAILLTIRMRRTKAARTATKYAPLMSKA